MPEFLIETYIPRDGPDVAALAAEQVMKERTQIRFLHAIFAPNETRFCLCQSPSAVRDAVTRARPPFKRITQAVSITHRSTADPDGLGHRTYRH